MNGDGIGPHPDLDGAATVPSKVYAMHYWGVGELGGYNHSIIHIADFGL